jgi:hypothetical protein
MVDVVLETQELFIGSIMVGDPGKNSMERIMNIIIMFIIFYIIVIIMGILRKEIM